MFLHISYEPVYDGQLERYLSHGCSGEWEGGPVNRLTNRMDVVCCQFDWPSSVGTANVVKSDTSTFKIIKNKQECYFSLSSYAVIPLENL